MNGWEWTVASAVLVITVVQLVAFYYFTTGDGDRSPLASSTGDGSGGSVSTTKAADSFDSDRFDAGETVRQCGECGAPNDPDSVYSFCRHCASEL